MPGTLVSQLWDGEYSIIDQLTRLALTYGMISSFIEDRGLSTKERLDEISQIIKELKA